MDRWAICFAVILDSRGHNFGCGIVIREKPVFHRPHATFQQQCFLSEACLSVVHSMAQYSSSAVRPGSLTGTSIRAAPAMTIIKATKIIRKHLPFIKSIIKLICGIPRSNRPAGRHQREAACSPAPVPVSLRVRPPTACQSTHPWNFRWTGTPAAPSPSV